MKKLMTMTVLTAAAGAALAVKCLRPIRAYAWFDKTHEQITIFALELLESAKKQKQAAFFKPYADKLIKGSKDPDNDGDVDKGSGTHSYTVADAKGRKSSQKGGYFPNRVGKYSKSARTGMEENYTCAVGLYKSGKTNEAMYALGRAIHFCEDITSTPHTANMKYGESSDNVHYMFEKHSVEKAKLYSPTGFDRRLPKIYSEDTFENAANKMAAAANKFAPQITANEPSVFEKAAKSLVPYAAENVMALLLRFYDDCNGERANYLTDGGLYSLRSEDSGAYLTLTPKGTALEKSDHSKEQRFTLVMSDNGTFSFKAKDGSFLTEDMKKSEKPADGAEPARFRAAAYGKNRFRISSGENFTKTIAASRRSLTLAEFKPEDKTQIWLLERYR